MVGHDPELQVNDRTVFDAPFTNDALRKMPVYPLIHFIRVDVEVNIGLWP